MTNRSGDLGVPLAAWGRGGKGVQVSRGVKGGRPESS